MRTTNRPGTDARLAILAAAVTTLAGAAGVNAQGVEYDISTAGATALGAFTRMNNNSGTGAAAPTAGTINRGPLAVGTSFQLGNTAYSVPSSGVAYYGQGILNAPVGGEPGNAADRARYYYLESGSIEGVLTLVDSQGLRSNAPGQVFLPQDPAANLGLWINGNRYNAPNSTGAFNSGRSIGSNSVTPATGQPVTRIAWSDVRFEQAFAVNGSAGFSRAPTTAGYGLGNGKIGNTNFQELRNAASIVGGTDPGTTRLRNESLAVVPFNLVANPGTGLAKVTKEEGGWLQAAGRLPNGADFNSVTRFVGSGTRNQGALNLGIDPSFGGGERDRRALGNYTSVTVDGTTGATVNVQIGDEADPLLSLTGSTSQDRNENRVGPSVRFSDKISGSSGVRATVVASRMGIGILSSGDSRSGDGNALASAANTGSPMRALAINFNNGHGYTQGTAANVTEGRYELWSAAQAITVSPTANPGSTDTTALNGRPIQGDIDDDGSGVGVHRKFLDNITRSVATGN
ncbi:MAG TPA: hypothetical protein PKB10_10125, partial [Tepidisphaeraceae bacterium]|nr:hypothetical protein [Tepidisphaeraceae bacterium]